MEKQTDGGRHSSREWERQEAVEGGVGGLEKQQLFGTEEQDNIRC